MLTNRSATFQPCWPMPTSAVTGLSSRCSIAIPNFVLQMHVSGWLLDYLIDQYPEDMAMLREMVIRPGRVIRHRQHGASIGSYSQSRSNRADPDIFQQA